MGRVRPTICSLTDGWPGGSAICPCLEVCEQGRMLSTLAQPDPPLRSTIWPPLPPTGPLGSATCGRPPQNADGQRHGLTEGGDAASGAVCSLCRAVGSGSPLGRSSPAKTPRARAMAHRVPRTNCALHAGSLPTSPAPVLPALDCPAAETAGQVRRPAAASPDPCVRLGVAGAGAVRSVDSLFISAVGRVFSRIALTADCLEVSRNAEIRKGR